MVSYLQRAWSDVLTKGGSMVTGRNDRISINSSLDCDGELRLRLLFDIDDYVDKEDAIKIINHLSTVFDIDLSITT